MSLESLPAEIITMIAGYLSLKEPDAQVSRKTATGICYRTDNDDQHHSNTEQLLLARSSSFWDFASASRQIRNVLFTSRESRFIKIKYDGREVEGIHPALLAEVSRLRLICQRKIKHDQEPEKSNAPLVSRATKFRGIGDILLPYYLIEKLDIDWAFLEKRDPRLKAMRECANATPIMRSDFRFSRPRMLSTVVDLHINLGGSAGLRVVLDCKHPGRQLDLILQQFDLPALRNFHLSHEFVGHLEKLEATWNSIVPAIHLHHWPCLQAVQICFVSVYRFRDLAGEGGDAIIWAPLVGKVLDHFATFKKTFRVDISLFWKFPHYASAFIHTSDGKATLRKEIMPDLDSFTKFANGLQGRAKTRPFTLQVYGKFNCEETEFVRLLRADYQPVRDVLPGTSEGLAVAGASIQYEINQDNIDDVLASTLSANGTIVTTVVLGIRVPVDERQRGIFLRQHDLQWDQVDWNDENTETDGESEQAGSDQSDAKDESYEEGETEAGFEEDDADGMHSENAVEDKASTHGSQHETVTRHSIVRIQVPGNTDDHDEWLNRHGFSLNDPVWNNFGENNEDDPLIGVGVEMTVHRGNAYHGSSTTRYFEPLQQLDEAEAGFGLDGFERNDNGDEENRSDAGDVENGGALIIEREVIILRMGGDESDSSETDNDGDTSDGGR